MKPAVTLLTLAALIVMPLAAVTAAVVASSGQACAPAPLLRLDHVPIAVRDLEAAGELFRRMGFTLKPGRSHDNGLANLHAKFGDGTELELITAAKAVDPLTAGYVDFLREGDGAAYLAFHAGDLDAVESLLRPLAPESWRLPGMLGFPPDHPWGRYFFALLNRSPTDRPEHYEHANTARSLAAVWLADDGVREMLTAFDASPCGTIRLPTSREAEVVPLAADSVLLLLSPEERLQRSRPIVGVTVRVAEAAAAAARLDAAGLAYTESATSLMIDPGVAPGLWIELRAGATEDR
jgi:hypothetical protein